MKKVSFKVIGTATGRFKSEAAIAKKFPAMSDLPIKPIKPTIDSRLKALSSSSCASLHSCPRKYQINKTGKGAERERTATLSYGTAFGDAVQEYFITGSLEAAKYRAFLSWDQDIEECGTPTKTLWEVLMGLEGLESFIQDSDLADYDLAYFYEKPACEYSFAIDLGDGFYYRGFVDLILRHRDSGVYTILEVKHTGMRFALESSYGKQQQALSYAVMLEALTKDIGGISDYKVIYLVHLTHNSSYEEFIFPKSTTDKAKFLRNLLVDKKLLELYSSLGDFPQHGASCTAWGRPCVHYETCDMSDGVLISDLETMDVLELDVHKGLIEESYDFVCNIKDSLKLIGDNI